jgi:hypothetical protein
MVTKTINQIRFQEEVGVKLSEVSRWVGRGREEVEL